MVFHRTPFSIGCGVSLVENKNKNTQKLPVCLKCNVEVMLLSCLVVCLSSLQVLWNFIIFSSPSKENFKLAVVVVGFQVDSSLSFLDGFVSEALAAGAAPYKPPHQRQEELAQAKGEG